MSLDDLPKIRMRKWIEQRPGFRARPRALRVAAWLRKGEFKDHPKDVKIIKETRWVVAWRAKP